VIQDDPQESSVRHTSTCNYSLARLPYSRRALQSDGKENYLLLYLEEQSNVYKDHLLKKKLIGDSLWREPIRKGAESTSNAVFLCQNLITRLIFDLFSLITIYVTLKDTDCFETILL
jgi:hypothetical protein